MGYVVFEDGFVNAISYGASEKWFKTYDEAIEYAMELVTERAAESKESKWLYSVMVYEAEKSVLDKTHDAPCGKVVFQWRNYKK